MIQTLKKRILIVDDDPDVGEMSSEVLASAGFEAARANTCAEAMAKMALQQADVLLLDIELPDECGLEFLPKFKAFHPQIPVIILTGLGYDEAKMQVALREGASGFVSKAVPPENMVLAIRNALRNTSDETADFHDGAGS